MTQNETTATATTNLQQACEPLFCLLTIPVQRYLAKNPIPFIERNGDQLIIHCLPNSITLDNIRSNSAFEQILHSIKHLYAHGDRISKKSAWLKEQTNVRLDNESIRMCIAYTYSSYKEDNHWNLIVNFIPSFTEHDPPRFIQHLDLADIDAATLAQLHNEGRIAKQTAKGITVWQDMTSEELRLHLDAMIDTCQTEFEQHIKRAVRKAYANHQAPNYLARLA